MFLHVSVILSSGGCLGPGPGKRLEGLTRGVQPRPRGVCVSQHALRQTPPTSRRLLLRTLRILLECILVCLCFQKLGGKPRNLHYFLRITVVSEVPLWCRHDIAILTSHATEPSLNTLFMSGIGLFYENGGKAFCVASEIPITSISFTIITSNYRKKSVNGIHFFLIHDND